MSTSTGPNLASAQRAIEKMMDDTCTITRGDGEPVLNTASGSMVIDDPTEVYSGKCMLSPEGDRLGVVVEGGGSVRPTTYRGSIPIDSGGDDVVPGDILTVTSSRRDPGLVGQTFRVDRALSGTFAVSRKFRLERRP